MFQFVNLVSFKYNIDESHGIGHSMNILHFAHQIFESERLLYPELKKYEKVIYVSAILHDMCDKKYMNEQQGLAELEHFLVPHITQDELLETRRIVSTMSYSKVKKQGFPELDNMLAYHIVREADLLCAYDFDRSMIYHMKHNCCNINNAFENANDLFQTRVFKHHSDNLFTTNFAKQKSLELEKETYCRINVWKELLVNENFDIKT